MLQKAEVLEILAGCGREGRAKFENNYIPRV
jgi:hypothetical protein